MSKAKLVKIAELTGLNFCDEDCDCGENNQLWWFPTGGAGKAEPIAEGWMNGATSEDIWEWLKKNGHVKAKAGGRQ